MARSVEASLTRNRDLCAKAGSARLSLLLGVLVGCGCSSTVDGSVEVIRSALTAADVMGFETASWTTTTPGVVLSQSSIHSQGTNSLTMKPSGTNGYTPLKSPALSTLAQVSPTLAWDIMLPTQQVNPNWYGTAQTYIDCPSRGVLSQFLGQVELTGKPLNVWNTISFSLTNAHLAALLGASYADLTITVVINVQVPTSAIYRVDNLRFIPVASNACGGRPNGTACNDNNACTQVDTCQAGACLGSNPVSCVASDSCHVAGTCNTSTGICSNPAKPDGSVCSDGNSCTQTDTCQAGACVGANPTLCVASDDCHVAGTCEPSTGICSNPQKSNGSVCNDNNACTQTDTCQGGGCVGTNPIICQQTTCHESSTCVPASGQCVVGAAVPNGTTCDDGNACTQGDACQQGTCVASNWMALPGACFPPTAIVKCAAGSSLNTCIDQLANIVGASTASQRSTIVSDLQVVANVPSLPLGMANQVRSETNPSGRPDRILTRLAMLGEMKTSAGTQLMKEIVQMPLPSTGTCIAEDSGQCDDFIERTYVAALQEKAMHGLAALGSAEGDNEVLAAVANNSNRRLRAVAVSAYLFNHGSTPANRAMLSAMLPSDQKFLADRFVKDASTPESIFGPALIDFYNKHPNLLPPSP